MKQKYNINISKLLLSILFILLFVYPVKSLVSEDSRLSYCLDAKNNLKFDIQVFPEIDSIYVAFVNKNPANFTDLYVNYVLVDTNTSKIISHTEVNINELEPGEIVCELYKGKKIGYNKNIDLLPLSLKYTYNNSPSSFYTGFANYQFRIDRCIDINTWNRVEHIKYNKNKEVVDTIVFKKLCNDSFYFNIGFEDLEIAQIPIKEAYLNYNNHNEKIFVSSPPNQDIISLLLSNEIPLENWITLKLDYSLPYKGRNLEQKFMLWFPFSTYFYDFHTHNIIPEKAFLTFENSKVMHVRDITQFTTEINLPKGFTHSEKPRELVYEPEIKAEVIKDDDNTTISVVYPSLCCLNISNFPSECLKFAGMFTPNEEASANQIIWSSMIINGDPKKLSYEIYELPIYKITFCVFLIISIIVLILIGRNRDRYYEFILLNFGIIVIDRTNILPIPSYFTLFDLLALINILITLCIMIRFRDFYFKKPESYKCRKCNKFHNKGKGSYDTHYRFRE
ncbi:hypothetical protein JXB41_07125 [Candidatus Woesearchaeota archaeon]|nr:hypothetical protein [Candidatus Woesearchaeota archaeon]